MKERGRNLGQRKGRHDACCIEQKGKSDEVVVEGDWESGA
jgi:hypothetical protein